jgi:hypothetical protein
MAILAFADLDPLSLLNPDPVQFRIHSFSRGLTVTPVIIRNPFLMFCSLISFLSDICVLGRWVAMANLGRWVAG